jgi:hypothetical protein
MNILRGEIDEIYVESGSAMAKVRVHAAFLRAPADVRGRC